MLGIHRLMSQGLTPTNYLGNAVATIVMAKWEGALDEKRLHRVLDGNDQATAILNAGAWRRGEQRGRSTTPIPHLAAGAVCLGCGMRRGAFAERNPGAPRRRVEIDGKPVRVVDVHCDCVIAAALPIVAGTALEKHFRVTLDRLNNPPMEKRIAAMDAQGIDVEAMSINEFWYGADRDLARRLIDVQNEELAKLCKASNGRLTAFASVALQFPELAAEQLDYAMKTLGLAGGAIGQTVEGEELSSPRFDPFWAKCEELDALVVHAPAGQRGGDRRRQARSRQGLSGKHHRESAGNDDRAVASDFRRNLGSLPEVTLCAADGGGYLASYADGSDAICVTFPNRCKDVALKKKPTEYLKQSLRRLDRLHARGAAPSRRDGGRRPDHG